MASFGRAPGPRATAQCIPAAAPRATTPLLSSTSAHLQQLADLSTQREIETDVKHGQHNQGHPDQQQQRNTRQAPAHHTQARWQLRLGLFKEMAGGIQRDHLPIENDPFQAEPAVLHQFTTRTGRVAPLEAAEQGQAEDLAGTDRRLGQRLQALEELNTGTTGGKVVTLQRGAPPFCRPGPFARHGRLIDPGDHREQRLTHFGFGKMQLAGPIGGAIEQHNERRRKRLIGLCRINEAAFGSLETRHPAVSQAGIDHVRTTTRSILRSAGGWGRKNAACRSCCSVSQPSLSVSRRKYNAPATRGSPWGGTCRYINSTPGNARLTRPCMTLSAPSLPSIGRHSASHTGSTTLRATRK